MSGTSMDGVDMAYCSFTLRKNKWTYQILEAKTFKYSSTWKNKLERAFKMQSKDLMQLDSEYGYFLGALCNMFIRSKNIGGIDLISSHGHTVFHQPSKGYTLQIGNGNTIAATTGIPVVYNFRQMDVALKGQGAPLVPMGDHHLFNNFSVCLNLGGIANLSFEKNKQRKAFDVCFVNMGLNEIIKEKNLSYDKDGKLASKGTVDNNLLKKISNMYEDFRTDRPSLSRELFESNFLKLITNRALKIEDRLRTFQESVVIEIERSLIANKQKGKILVTGGGALNKELIRILQNRLGPKLKIVIPEKQIVEFKEAIIFGFLGVLRVRNENNVYCSVTGASRDSSSGVLVQ